jgi:hypothetical protein
MRSSTPLPTKQVPLLRSALREAVRNNVPRNAYGCPRLREHGVGTFVLISTDKAVDPVNVLGATKRLAEMTCQSLADHRSTRFVTVRFGNVLDSAGSVVPLFREQIRNGGPVTVTDPEVTRFFMTIPEACLLILQASAIGTHEAIYTLDMGEPVPIRLLAEQMIRLAENSQVAISRSSTPDCARVRNCTRPCSMLTNAIGLPRIPRSCRPSPPGFSAIHRWLHSPVARSQRPIRRGCAEGPLRAAFPSSSRSVHTACHTKRRP